MKKRLKLRKALYAIFGAMFITGALIAIVYLWVVLGDRGLYADDMHTSGYITSLDLVVMALMVLSTIAAIICFLKALGVKR